MRKKEKEKRKKKKRVVSEHVRMRWVGRRERIATAESTGVQPRGHGVQWTPSEYKEGEPLFFLGVLD